MKKRIIKLCLIGLCASMCVLSGCGEADVSVGDNAASNVVTTTESSTFVQSSVVSSDVESVASEISSESFSSVVSTSEPSEISTEVSEESLYSAEESSEQQVSVPEEISQDEEPIVEETDWKKAYKDQLNEAYNDPYYGNNVMFNLLDVDKDGCPELFISYAETVAGGGDLFTFSNGTLKKLQVVFGYGQINYDANTKRLLNHKLQQGIEMIDVYELNNGDINTVFSAVTNSAYYKINGNDVSAEEYMQECEKYNVGNQEIGSNWVEVARQYRLEPDMINSVIDSY